MNKSTLRGNANSFLKHIYNQNGITLIALVVTIIVLIILAGISINLILGENGIITKTNEAKVENEKGRYKEEINILAMGESIKYQTDEITFDELISTVKTKIEEKSYVESVTQKKVSSYVVLEAQTDLNIVSVKFSENGIEIVEGTVEPSEEVSADIFNYTINADGDVEIIGFNFDNMEYEETRTEDVYLEEKIVIKNMETLSFPSAIDGKNVVAIKLDTHILNGEVESGFYTPFEGEGINNGFLTGIKEVIYPSTVKSIERGIVLSDVEKITLSEGLESIGDRAFYSWSSVGNITIPSSVTNVGELIFCGCNSVTINVEGKDSIEDFLSASPYAFCNISLKSNVFPPFTVNYLGK